MSKRSIGFLITGLGVAIVVVLGTVLETLVSLVAKRGRQTRRLGQGKQRPLLQ